MTRSEAHEHLQLCTVKIESDYDVGSGFFIDKGLIVTCHHVIEDCSPNQLRIIWQGENYQALKIESNVKDDLALITLKINKRHPCVKLDSTINPHDRCSFFGFPENHRDNGMIRNCEHEGTTKKLLAFKEGQFEHGFSGSAILNFETGKVCGIVNKTRDAYSNLGGYAIPLHKLIEFLKSKAYEIDDNGSIFSKEMFKNWVWLSSMESVNKLQFSILALLETLVAIGISFFVWIYYEFYEHIIMGLIIAPLFFLRTKKSEREAIALLLKLLRVEKQNKFFMVPFILLFISILYHYKISWYITGFLLFFLILYICIFIIYYKTIPELLKKFILFITSILIILIWINEYFKLLELSFLSLNAMLTTSTVTWFGSKFGFSILLIYVYHIRATIYSFFIKIYITIKNLSFKSIIIIPKNWFKVIMSTDIFLTPEILPTIEQSKINNKLIEYGFIKMSYFFSIKHINSKFTKFKKFKRIKSLFQIIYYPLVNLFIFLENIISLISNITINLFFILLELLFMIGLNFIVAILFRYSLKSTAWIYLPLIWLIQPQDKQNLTTRLKIESKNFIAYLMFFYSLIVVFVFTLLPLIFPHTELGVYLQTLAIPDTLKSIFFAYEFNLWHLTRFLSALITIVFMVSFTKILIRRELEPSYGDFWGATLLSLRDVRSVLTLIALGFTAYHIWGLLPDGFMRELWANMKVVDEE